MKNTTNMKLAKKYEDKVELVEKDFDGYWGYAKKGYMFENTGSHTAHGENQKEFLADLKTISTCDCKDCKEGMA